MLERGFQGFADRVVPLRTEIGGLYLALHPVPPWLCRRCPAVVPGAARHGMTRCRPGIVPGSACQMVRH